MFDVFMKKVREEGGRMRGAGRGSRLAARKVLIGPTSCHQIKLYDHFTGIPMEFCLLLRPITARRLHWPWRRESSAPLSPSGLVTT